MLDYADNKKTNNSINYFVIKFFFKEIFHQINHLLTGGSQEKVTWDTEVDVLFPQNFY